jgi:acetolactate synthase-1/2/3 large subunit
VDSREAVRVMDERLLSDIGLVVGAGHCFGFSVLEMKKARPFQVWVTSFGCIGQTIPSAIGVGVGLGGKPVVHLAGDGPMVLDVRILRNVISIPYRRMCYGQDS